MNSGGWIKLYRRMLNNPIVMKDADHLAVWVYLLLKANHTEYDIFYSGQRRTLKAGQLRISRATIAKDLKISESKVQRILKLFESEQQIEQQTNFHDRVISIISWDEYQQSEQQDEQQVNSNRTASEQQVNANKNIKNIKNNKNNNYIYSPAITEIVDYLNEITGSSYKASTKKTRACIQARLNEGFTVDDFKVVIWRKTKEWKGTDYEKFLRPETLFGNKFEGYLNQKETTTDRLGWLDDVRL